MRNDVLHDELMIKDAQTARLKPTLSPENTCLKP